MTIDSTAPPTTAAPARRMSLANVTKGKLAKPLRVLLFGVEGIGKSTFASKAPSPIFLCAEDGTTRLDVTRFPEPKTWDEVFEAIDSLVREEHEHKTLVLDTLDWLEPICWRAVCDKPDPKTKKKYEVINDWGYGRGFDAALGEWRRFAAALARLREAKDMHIVMLAHSWVKTFKNPLGDDFDRYMMKLHEKAAAFLREWSDVVLFTNYETLTHETNGRVKGISTGARMVYTQRTAGWDAKNRYDLPETLPLDWDAFAEAVAAHRPADPGKLHARIVGMLVSAEEALAARVRAAVQSANGDAAELARIADKLSATLNIKNQENAS